MHAAIILGMLLIGILLAFRSLLTLAVNIGCGLLQADAPFSPAGSFMQGAIGLALLVVALGLVH
ncbi:MAG TPA: hypothetical protein VFS21_08575 [Roseiflexaceae bacterium]|nr:hypothetical protein [Roseiflexaceae bacterium]